MPLLRINETKRTTDAEGRLTREYVVESDGKENIETLIFAYTSEGTRLPQRKEVNPFRKNGGEEVRGKLTYVDKIRVGHDGKDWNTYKVTISYAPPEEASDPSDDNATLDQDNFPWNERSGFSQTGDVITQGTQGLDARDQPYRYSNGNPVVMEITLPITILNITRKPLTSQRNSQEVSSEFFQKVNDATVNIRGVSYGPRTLLVQAFDVSLERFTQADPDTGTVKVTEYYVETIVLAYNRITWAERVVDEGTVAYFEIKDKDNPSGPKIKVIQPKQNKITGQTILEVMALDGQGNPIFDDKGVVINAAQTTGSSKSGVQISATDSVASGSGAQTVLAFLNFVETSFGGMNLNEGF